MSALKGIKVIELANEGSAFAGKLLGDMGADVILVEPPTGDISRGYPPFFNDEQDTEKSLYWWHYNTSKRGVVLDLEQAESRTAFLKLIETADILIESEPIDRLAKLDIDYPTLAKIQPDLIHASITPFGRENSRREEVATDLTILAGGGSIWSCGYDDHTIPPIHGGGNQGYQTSCHYAVMSILTALVYRGAGGEGQFIDISHHASTNITTEHATYFWLLEQSTVQRQTGRHAKIEQTAPVQLECADGRHVSSGMLPRTPAQFELLLKWIKSVLSDEEFPEMIFLEMATMRESIDQAEIGVDDEITAIYSATRDAFALMASKLDAQSYFIGAQNAGLAAGVIYSPEEAYEDAHFIDRGFQVEVEHEQQNQNIRYPGAPYKFSATPWKIQRRAPYLNEHADAVWNELGLDEALQSAIKQYSKL